MRWVAVFVLAIGGCGGLAGDSGRDPDPAGGDDAGPRADADRPERADASFEPFMLEDSLRGSSSGNLVGGQITATGWRVTNRQDRIWWEIPPLVEGSIEFTVTGMTNGATSNMTLVAHELFAMYEAGYGMPEPVAYLNDFRNNYYKVMVRVHGNNATPGQQEMDWSNCAGGDPGFADDAICPCSNGYFSRPLGGTGTWDGTGERIRIEWNAASGARLLRNGVEVVSHTWPGDNSFAPVALHFSFGTSRATVIPEAGLPVGAVFSDLVVDGMTGSPTFRCAP